VRRVRQAEECAFWTNFPEILAEGEYFERRLTLSIEQD
jgi:hypothetical protein